MAFERVWIDKVGRWELQWVGEMCHAFWTLGEEGGWAIVVVEWGWGGTGLLLSFN